MRDCGAGPEQQQRTCRVASRTAARRAYRQGRQICSGARCSELWYIFMLCRDAMPEDVKRKTAGLRTQCIKRHSDAAVNEILQGIFLLTMSCASGRLQRGCVSEGRDAFCRRSVRPCRFLGVSAAERGPGAAISDEKTGGSTLADTPPCSRHWVWAISAPCGFSCRTGNA